MSKKYVIVGGVAGGASAATRLRRLEEDAEIQTAARSKIEDASCHHEYHYS